VRGRIDRPRPCLHRPPASRARDRTGADALASSQLPVTPSGGISKWHNLADSYRGAGRLDDAIALHEQNLSDFERVLGPAHPDSLGSRNSLGYAYPSAGRVREAIPLFELALADCERVLGHGHRETIRVGTNLADARRQAESKGNAAPS
jgi:tetratricopeptide (TPR) repeat protein